MRDKINVTFKRAGLATTVMGTCSCSTQRKVSHEWIIEPQRNLDTKSEMNNFAINQGVILSAYSFGCGYRKLLRGLACLGLKFMHFRSFKKCEEKVGRALQKVAHEAMEEGLQKEKEKSETFSTIQNGTLPALTVSVDMGWNKRSSGRRYDSPSGVLLAIGAETNKIVDKYIYINQCHVCDKLKQMESKVDDSSAGNDLHQLKQNIERLRKHKCTKNFEGSSKSMESFAIVQLLKNAPEKLKVYVRKIVLDDDTTTPSHIQEDTGPQSKGCLPAHLAGVTILADPSHRRRTVSNRLYTLAGKRK